MIITKLKLKCIRMQNIGASILIAAHVFLDQPSLDSSDFYSRGSCSKILNGDNDSMNTVSDELTIKTNNNTSVTLKVPRGEIVKGTGQILGESYR